MADKKTKTCRLLELCGTTKKERLICLKCPLQLCVFDHAGWTTKMENIKLETYYYTMIAEKKEKIWW